MHLFIFVDAKHNLPIDYKVTNENDSRVMSSMLRRTKVILGTTNLQHSMIKVTTPAVK